MNIDKINFKENLSLDFMQDLAVIFASYQPNKIASDLLRVSLKSLKNTKLDKISVWIIDVGSPNHDQLVKTEEFPEFNFVYINYVPSSKLDLFKKLFQMLINGSIKREGSYINSWSIHFALEYFKKKSYMPNYIFTSQTDVIFTEENSLQELKKKFYANEKLIAAGFRAQKNLGKNYDIIHSLGCMWDYQKFLDQKLNLFPDFPDYDVSELAIVNSVKKGFEIFSYNNVRTDKSFHTHIENTKYSKLGNGVDICLNEKNEVAFLHLGRGVDKSIGNYKKENAFQAKDWIKWYFSYFT